MVRAKRRVDGKKDRMGAIAANGKDRVGNERGSGLHRLCVQGHLLSKVGRDGSLRASVGPAGIQE